jgi:hypothetical protein
MSVFRDDKVTVKSRNSGFTFRDNYSNYKPSKTYVPRKEKAHRRLLARQKSMSEVTVPKLSILAKAESENQITKPKIPEKSHPELSRREIGR